MTAQATLSQQLEARLYELGFPNPQQLQEPMRVFHLLVECGYTLVSLDTIRTHYLVAIDGEHIERVEAVETHCKSE